MSYSTVQLRGLDGQIYYVKRKFNPKNQAIESSVYTQPGNCIFQMQHEDLPPLPEEEVLTLALTNLKSAANTHFWDEISSRQRPIS